MRLNGHSQAAAETTQYIVIYRVTHIVEINSSSVLILGTKVSYRCAKFFLNNNTLNFNTIIIISLEITHSDTYMRNWCRVSDQLSFPAFPSSRANKYSRERGGRPGNEARLTTFMYKLSIAATLLITQYGIRSTVYNIIGIAI